MKSHQLLTLISLVISGFVILSVVSQPAAPAPPPPPQFDPSVITNLVNKINASALETIIQEALARFNVSGVAENVQTILKNAQQAG